MSLNKKMHMEELNEMLSELAVGDFDDYEPEYDDKRKRLFIAS